uniref:HTH CENPB-type domain-containing protein n=1 Tax=Latimeria chalumnae TaxID=7897 RepID=H3A1R5_LATCH
MPPKSTHNEMTLKHKVELIKNSEGYNDVDLLIWEWFQRARSLNMLVSGTMIQEKVLEFAKQLNKPDFKASNGWLGRFKGRHNIAFSAVSGEKGYVDGDVVEDWKLKLPDTIAGYQPKDIYNKDESGCVKRALPTKTLAVHGEDCTGGKKAKERITMSLCCNMAG